MLPQPQGVAHLEIGIKPWVSKSPVGIVGVVGSCITIMGIYVYRRYVKRLIIIVIRIVVWVEPIRGIGAEPIMRLREIS